MQFSGTFKEILFGLINLQLFLCMGVSRSYIAFLFYQLDLPDSTIHLNQDQKTWIGACVGILTPFGCLLTGILMDKVGRKVCILMWFIPLIISWMLVSLASTYNMLIIAMLIQSTAIGMGFSTLPYVSEISTPKYRGSLLSLVDVMLNAGVLFSNSLMYILKWNVVSLIFVGVSTGSLLITLVLPESPVWLYSRGEKGRAIKILCYLRSKQPHELQDEIQDMEESANLARGHKTGMLVTLSNCLKAWRQFSIATVLFFFVVLAGPYTLMSYTVTVFTYLDTPYDAATLALGYSIAGFCGSFLTPIFVHNLKRKMVLAISSGGMAISMGFIYVYEIFFLESEEKPLPWIVPFYLCFFTFLCNLGVIPIAFVVAAELFPLEVRGALQGIYGFSSCFVWALSLKFYPVVLFDYGILAILSTFSVSCLILFLYAIFILPETSGKTLNEIQEVYFSKNKNKSKRASIS